MRKDPQDLCERCGHPIQIGQYPFCKGNPADHEPGRATGIERDEIPGGMWLENYGPHPIKVYSHGERLRLLKQVRYDKTTGQPYVLTEKDNFAPMPGTDKDAQGIPNPNGFRSLAAQEILKRNGRVAGLETSVEARGGGVGIDAADPNDVPNDPRATTEGVRPFNLSTDDLNPENVREFLRRVTDG